MKVLAIDPGCSRSGVSLVELSDDGWLHIRFGAHLENDGPEIARWIHVAAIEGYPVAIEEASGQIYKGRSAAQLIESAKAEGAFRSAALRLGAKVVMTTARDWRGELCRSSGASDAQIRIAVEGCCRTIPPLSAEAREHVYDTAGQAIVVISRLLGRTLRLPPAVEAAIHVQRETEKAKRAAKKDEPKEKRTLSRRQRERKSEAGKRSWTRRTA